MKNLKFRWRPLLITILIAIAFWDIEARTYSSSYATRSAYRRTYTGSSYSGSNSAGKLAMSTTMWIVIPIVVVTAVLLLVFCIPVVICLIKRWLKKRSIERKAIIRVKK